MKKITSLALAVFMVVSMLAVSFTSASAAVGIDFNETGSITLNKKNSETGEPVVGATFTAYKVFDLVANTGMTDEGTLKVTGDFYDAVKDYLEKGSMHDEDILGGSQFKGELPADYFKNVGTDAASGSLFKDTDNLERFISEMVKEIYTKSISGENFTESLTAQGVYTKEDLDLGVYVIVETAVPSGYNITTSSFLVSIPQWEQSANEGKGEWIYNIEASPKDDPMKIDKVIDNRTGPNGEGVEDDVYAIGNKVPFKVTTKIPNYGLSTLKDEKLTAVITDDQYKAMTFTFTDEFAEGLTFNNKDLTDFVVKVGDVTLVGTTDPGAALKTRYDLSKNIAPEKPDYYLNAQDNKFTLNIAWEALDAHQGEEITLSYSATLNEKAVVGDENKNKISLKYTSNPEWKETQVIEDDADVFTYELHLDKTFNGKTASEAGVNPTPVTFRITTKENAQADSDYIPVCPKTVAEGYDGTYTYYVWDAEDNEFVQKVNTYDMQLNGEAKLILKGLKDGTYYLEETKTVEGFGKLQTKVKIVISEDRVETENGVIIGCKANSYVNNGGVDYVIADENLNHVDGNIGTLKITVNNVKKQFNLPQTGGLGLWIFTIAGGVVMAGAIIFFAVIRKKKRNQ